MSTIIIARLLGPLMLVGAAAVLANRTGIRQIVKDAAEHKALTYIAGAIGLLGGIAILQFHNVWVAGWPVLITIIGLLSVIRGAARMMFPAQVSEMEQRLVRREEGLVASAVISATIGAILTIQGFRTAL